MTKNQLNTRAKLNIYHSLIHSHFSYCALAWLNKINKKQLKMLKILQKKAIRIIHGKKFNSHTNELFNKSNITRVENIFEKQSLILTFNYQQKKLPKAIIELYDDSLFNNNIITRYLTNCELKPKYELKEGNMMLEILDNWNKLGKSLREEQSLNSFKKKLMIQFNKTTECNKINCYSCQNG